MIYISTSNDGWLNCCVLSYEIIADAVWLKHLR